MISPVVRSFVLCLTLALAACSEGEDTASADETRAVTVARVEMRSMAKTLSASGILVPREEVTVDSEISGFPVLSVLVDEGDQVRAGQPLARLDETLLRARLARARAQLAQARAEAAEAQGEADRVQGLDGTGVLSDEQIASRRFKAQSAAAAVGVSQAMLRELQVQQRRMIIRAPVAGVVLERITHIGEIASPGGDPMFRIARNRLVELDAEVPEDALAGLAPGLAASVSLPDGLEVDGKVRFVSPRVDPSTKLGRVRVSLPSNRQLRTGGFARAEFKIAAQPLPAVPEKAIQYEAGGPIVAAIDDHDRVSWVPVRPGVRAGGWVELVEGPPAGTRVALGGAAFLFKGDRIRPVDASGKPAGKARK